MQTEPKRLPIQHNLLHREIHIITAPSRKQVLHVQHLRLRQQRSPGLLHQQVLLAIAGPLIAHQMSVHILLAYLVQEHIPAELIHQQVD